MRLVLFFGLEATDKDVSGLAHSSLSEGLSTSSIEIANPSDGHRELGSLSGIFPNGGNFKLFELEGLINESPFLEVADHNYFLCDSWTSGKD